MRLRRVEPKAPAAWIVRDLQVLNWVESRAVFGRNSRGEEDASVAADLRWIDPGGCPHKARLPAFSSDVTPHPVWSRMKARWMVGFTLVEEGISNAFRQSPGPQG
jgi:hypothetical protein